VSLFSSKKPDNESLKEAVLTALKTVDDPDLHRDLVSLGMIKDLKVEGSKVSFAIELTTPSCPMKEVMKKECHEAVSKIEGVTDIDIAFTANTAAHQAATKPEQQMIPGVKNIIAVSSGKGGVGKSTVASNLAIALKQTGSKVGLMDADAYGPNIPMMMGVTQDPESDGTHIFPPEAYGIKVMSVGLVAKGDTPVIWRGPMLHSVVKQFLFQVSWGELDYLVVDMPPGTGDVQLSLAQQTPLAGVVMVTTPQAVAQADVCRAIQMFRKVEVSVLGIIENMSYFLCPDNDKKYEIFGSGGGEKLAKEYDIPLMGKLAIDPRVAQGGDTGKPIVVSDPESLAAKEFVKLAGTVAQKISIANKLRKPLPIVG